MSTASMESAHTKQSAKSDTVHNGKSVAQHDSTNGTASSKTSESNSSRKERRKDWWSKQMKSKTASNDFTKSEVKPVHTKTSPTQVKEEQQDGEKPKLRNRKTIAKPDSLKYEPDFNRGFHSKLMQNLYTDTSRKKKKKEKPQPEPTSASSSPAKRKSSQAVVVEQENSKKPKPAEIPEVFDSYKFSLNLINGEVDTSKSPVGKDSKDKYVLFIGNLPYDITREQLEEHFRKTGGIKSIRIPREKGTDKGRGFAYMEFDGRISHGIALRLHQTTLGGRKINVEFTSIGGGKSEARKEKLKQKNKKRRKMKMNW